MYLLYLSFIGQTSTRETTDGASTHSALLLSMQWIALAWYLAVNYFMTSDVVRTFITDNVRDNWQCVPVEYIALGR